MPRHTISRAGLVATAAFLTALAACDTGSRHDGPASASTPPSPGSVNVLKTPPSGTGSIPAAISPGGSPSAATPSTGPTSPPGPTPGSAGTATAPGAGAASAPGAGAPPATAAAPSPAAPPSGPQLFGTIPHDPETGFDGSLYFVGERLVPGSIISVAVNGIPTKVLPATFVSSELLSTYVYLTVPATYTFTALAPDGSASTPIDVVVPDGGAAALFGLEDPEIQLVFPPSLDTSFAGTVWLIGDHFMPGSAVTVSVAGVPVLVEPLVFVNDRTVGWVTATPFAGDVTIQVTNPTLRSSGELTLTVGPATPPVGASGPTPQVTGPSSVASPFLGAVHLIGAGIVPGAVAELRPRGGGAAVATSPLVWLSTSEAHWMLVYPQPGAFEMRVVNPGGAASPWRPFEVR